MATTTLTIDEATGRLRLDRPLFLGQSYALAVSGVSYTPTLIFADCDGNPVAESDAGDEGIVLDLGTTQLRDLFDRAGIHGAPGVITVHAWVADADDRIVAQSDIAVFYAPYANVNSQLTKIDVTGKTGAQGIPGPEGPAGRDGVYVPTAGFFAFTVSDDGDLIVHAASETELYALDQNGNLDHEKPRFTLETVGDEKHLIYHFYDTDNHITMDIGNIRGAQGVQGETGATGSTDATAAMSGTTLATQTIVDIRNAVRAIGAALGATLTALALAFIPIGAHGAGASTTDIGATPITNLPPVVTDVAFEGLQPTLPYPTNAIPADVIADAPWLASESDSSVGLTNGTIYIHGQTITPLTAHQDLSGVIDYADARAAEVAGVAAAQVVNSTNELHRTMLDEVESHTTTVMLRVVTNIVHGVAGEAITNIVCHMATCATNYTDAALAEFGTAAYSNAVDFAPAALSEAAMLKSSPVAADANYNHDIYPLNEPVVQYISKTQVRVIGDTRFMVGASGVYLPTNMTVAVASALDTGAIAAGKDYCVCLDAQTNIIVSLASTATTNNAVRVLGGFHTICRSVPANYQEEPVSVFGGALHPLAGWTAGDILPASVWSLNFRPACDDPGGMVYCKEADIWVDIYNGSGSIYAPQSKFGGSRIHTKSQVAFMTGYANVGKVLLSDWEFFMAAIGSNCGSRLKGNVQPNPDTTGGHLDENGHPMISAIGCEEMCGLQVQWLRDNVGYATEQNLKWDNTASTGNPYYPTVAYDDGENSFGSFYAMVHYRAVGAGGNWGASSAVTCGPLFRGASGSRSSVVVYYGGRGSSRSTRTWTR